MTKMSLIISGSIKPNSKIIFSRLELEIKSIFGAFKELKMKILIFSFMKHIFSP